MSLYNVGNKRTVVGLFGAGGFGREIMPTLISTNQQPLKSILRQREFVFVDLEGSRARINDVSVISQDEFFGRNDRNKFFNVAIADYKIRRAISEAAISAGITPMSITSDRAAIQKTTQIGQGAIVADFVCITANAEIGDFFHANIYSYVAHDCKIGNFVTFAPGVQCNGNVIVEDNVYIGANATIKPGSSDKPRVIGAGSIIGMGAVVINDVEPNTIVVGNPAKKIS